MSELQWTEWFKGFNGKFYIEINKTLPSLYKTLPSIFHHSIKPFYHSCIDHLNPCIDHEKPSFLYKTHLADENIIRGDDYNAALHVVEKWIMSSEGIYMRC